MKEKDEKYMMMALDEARRAFDEGEIPIGAVIVCQNRISAWAVTSFSVSVRLWAWAMMRFWQTMTAPMGISPSS